VNRTVRREIQLDKRRIERRLERAVYVNVAGPLLGAANIHCELANTAEPLFIYNRSGNRPSHEGATCDERQAARSDPKKSTRPKRKCRYFENNP
jgi:hypothetical protein